MDSRLVLFLGAALALAVTPGSGIFYVLARSVAGGRREGLLSAAGTFVGGMVHVTAAAVGLSVVMANSALAYNAVRYAGAAYLAYLGVRMIRERNVEVNFSVTARRSPVWQGALTEALNPKTALFFLSFIPQFVAVERGHVMAQFFVLGAISVVLNTSADLVVAWFAGPLGAKMKRHAKKQRTASGVAMIGLGVYVAADS